METTGTAEGGEGYSISELSRLTLERYEKKKSFNVLTLERRPDGEKGTQGNLRDHKYKGR